MKSVISFAFWAAIVTAGCQTRNPNATADAASEARDGGPIQRDARLPPPAERPGVLGRAGPIVLDEAGFATAVDEARVLEQWRRGEAPPLDALDDPRLRRRIMTRALETRVVRQEVTRRGLKVDAARFDEMLRLAAGGHRLETPPTPAQLASAKAVTDLDAALAARFGAPADRVRRVGLDVLEGALFADAMLDAVPDERIRQAWIDEQTKVSVDLVRISRVPTSGEIDRAIVERAREMAPFYEKNRRLFSTPERAYIRRMLVVVPPDATPEVKAEARARAEALRAEVAAGADLEAVVRREGVEREARAGGRVRVTRPRFPAAFEGPEGVLSPVMAVPEGWQFFRVETRAAAVKRELDDPRVQREIAAQLLRDADALPAAKRTAAQVRKMLIEDPAGEPLVALVKSARLQRTTTESFPRAGQKVVPVIGIAPGLFDAIFALTPEGSVTDLFTIRQWYVVARLVARTTPDLAAWPAEKARFTAQWQARNRSRVVDAWLTRRLDGRPMWIDTPKLNGLSRAQLGLSDDGSEKKSGAPSD